MSNKKQSSVEWLAEKFTEDSHNQWEIKVLVKKALQMHKEEIIKAAGHYFHEYERMTKNTLTPTQYYNETFGGKTD